ncbi:hypothetical protein D3C77_451050 [compost metagenome]
MPIIIVPSAMIRKPSVRNIMLMTLSEAANLALSTASRCSGWAMIRLKVPLFRSLLIASKPSPIPSSGPRNPIKLMNDGNVPSDSVNSLRMMKSLAELSA